MEGGQQAQVGDATMEDLPVGGDIAAFEDDVWLVRPLR